MKRDQPVRIWANAIVHYGRGAPPPGKLSAFSVSSEREAEVLLTLACVRRPDGHFVARELGDEQSAVRVQPESEADARSVLEEHVSVRLLEAGR